MFDDRQSLEGLADVSDATSALLYVLAGDTGPLGRPLSLATFLLNASSWPENASDFLLFNTLLHLFNGGLVAWLTLLLAKAMPDRIQNSEWFAVAVAVVWLIHPAWAFLVLHAVQRMAILATTFVLVGLIAYLKARSLVATHPLRSMLLMAGCLAVGTSLAMLSKENGALLPLFAAALEWLLRAITPQHGPDTGPNPIFSRIWKHWGTALFWLPTLILTFYLLQHWPGFSTSSPLRDFTGGQRLLTEARVLWQYVFNLFLPRPINFSPFFDDYPISQNLFTQISTLYAVLGWTIVAATAWLWRRRYPLFFFSVAWFLIGHSIESSVVQLEIYFEHRNYLPSIGPLILIIYGLWQFPHDLRRLRMYLLGAYSLLLAFVLWQLTTMWGQPIVAAQMLTYRHPLSVRAIQFNANQLSSSGQVAEAATFIWQAHMSLPNDTGLAVQGLQFLCAYSSTDDYKLIVEGILPQLREGNFSHQVATSLPLMYKQLSDGTCPSQRASHLHNIIDALMANQNFIFSARTMATLHYLKGRLYMRDRDFNLTVEHMLESSRLDPNIDLSLEVAAIFASAGSYSEAFKTLDSAMANCPSNPIVRTSWQKRIDSLRSQLLQAKDSAHP
jgi:hypothetical protein